ncbi:MAG: MBL fold metallo-hydrolase [Methyloceanibacter sp.]|jgi:alkyl sulfatase BDS1-like metallo-beta-lactamase superfamily hydrolase|nr:MBL fold metallo-hydrolase [Methyloceanibacter sp.]
MTTRREFLEGLPAAGIALAAAGGIAFRGEASEKEAAPGQAEPSWHSPSLRLETATAPNGAITTQAAIDANERFGATEKMALKVADGVYLLSGWGLGHSMAIEAPKGWIIIDTGDSTRAAAEMREHLEKAVSAKIKVAAILLTHWHYADGTDAWLDEGAEIWGHEWLDANRTASTGVSIKSGFYRARAIAQFGVFHPTEGPDAFPNAMAFTPEKLIATSSYRPPTRLFENGKSLKLTVAGEDMEVAPNRSDTSDSVGFYFPRLRTLISNFMVPGFIFNVYSLRGGPFRSPVPFIEDTRWMESKNAEVLLDVHGPAVTGADAVKAAIQRSADQVQLIYDQTLRMIARGMDDREAAENVYMPRHQRGDWETYGQVESHVRQVYNGTVGWFGHDVYDINPLSLREEAARTVTMSGGVDAVHRAAAAAIEQGGINNWQWALRLTSLLLRLDPKDASAQKSRAAAARALGQVTSSANARGWYITEALQIEGRLFAMGKPVTLDVIRAVLGTPSVEDLEGAPADVSLEFLRYMVDPRKAEDKRLAFTLGIEGEAELRRVELRNGVIVVSTVTAPAETHMDLSRLELAEFILGFDTPIRANGAIAEFDSCLDRSNLLSVPGGLGAQLDDPHEQAELIMIGEQ